MIYGKEHKEATCMRINVIENTIIAQGFSQLEMRQVWRRCHVFVLCITGVIQTTACGRLLFLKQTVG